MRRGCEALSAATDPSTTSCSRRTTSRASSRWCSRRSRRRPIRASTSWSPTTGRIRPPNTRSPSSPRSCRSRSMGLAARTRAFARCARRTAPCCGDRPSCCCSSTATAFPTATGWRSTAATRGPASSSSAATSSSPRRRRAPLARGGARGRARAPARSRAPGGGCTRATGATGSTRAAGANRPRIRGGNFGVARDLFERVDGFDEALARLRQGGLGAAQPHAQRGRARDQPLDARAALPRLAARVPGRPAPADAARTSTRRASGASGARRTIVPRLGS